MKHQQQNRRHHQQQQQPTGADRGGDQKRKRNDLRACLRLLLPEPFIRLLEGACVSNDSDYKHGQGAGIQLHSAFRKESQTPIVIWTDAMREELVRLCQTRLQVRAKMLPAAAFCCCFAAVLLLLVCYYPLLLVFAAAVFCCCFFLLLLLLFAAPATFF
jgi:hypothetical protein